MRKRKIAIICASVVAVAIPAAAVLTVSILSNQPKISASYIYKPESEESIRLKQQISEILDETVGQNGKLPLMFDTLTQENQYTSSQNAWFLELSAAFKWIDPRLSFERTPRTNATVTRSFYDKNTMMRSFFWSADYHNVGTWMGYNFTDNFATTNLYQSLYQYAEDFKKTPNDARFQFKEYAKDTDGNILIDESGRPSLGNNFAPQYQPENWIPDLSQFLYESNVPANYIAYYDAAPESAKHPSLPTLKSLAPENGGTDEIPYFFSWQDLEIVDKAIQMGSIELDGEKINETLFLRELMWNQIGYWADITTTILNPNEQYWLGLAAWLNKQQAAIPYISTAGPKTVTTSLSRKGLYPVKNSNTENNYRDWFVNADLDKGTTQRAFSHWSQTDPYKSSNTPFNPTFTRAPNYQYFQSTWNGLIDYKTEGDWVEKDGVWVPPPNKMFLQGAKSIKMFDETNRLVHTIGGKTDVIDTWYVHPEDIEQTSNAVKYEFEIPTAENEVFKWYGPNGADNKKLTAQDYFAGILTFILASKWTYSVNGYYTTLFNLDIEATLEANNHFFSSRPGDVDNPNAANYRSMNSFKFVDNPVGDKANIYTLIQTSPNVNTLDVLTKQYFNPVPSNHNGVKYILETNTQAEIDKIDKLDGQGNPTSKSFLVWSKGNLAVNEQTPGYSTNVYGGSVNAGKDITGWWSPGPYILDSSNGFSQLEFVENKNFFSKFPKDFFRNIEPLHTPGNENFDSVNVEKVTMVFGEGFSITSNYEQFINNQIDTSLIPPANLVDAFNRRPDDIRMIGTEFLPRTDLLTFNTNIYEVDEYGIPLVNDATGDKVLKSYVTKEYEKSFISDLHLGVDGNSYKLRSAVLELIDWYSLSSLATPNNTPYYQNSLIPYGNGPIKFESDFSTLFEQSLESGNIGFTTIPYSQYRKNWEEQLK